MLTLLRDGRDGSARRRIILFSRKGVVMAVPDRRVREELAEELHRANERFHAVRAEWEKWLEANEFRHEERVASAWERLREAEHEVEAAEEKIKSAMGGAEQGMVH